MHVDDLDYDLPERLIAQVPPPQREDARLLGLDRARGTLTHSTVRELDRWLAPKDLLVLNDTRVLPARLHAQRQTGGRVDVLLLEELEEGTWSALVRAGGSLLPGEELRVDDGAGLRLVRRLGPGTWRVKGAGADLRALMDRHGRMPLPPYIRRERNDEREGIDRERYQTLHARREGAVAAPTAGLHLTPALLRALEERGVGVAYVTLHVGLGTFQPVRADRLEDHDMHEEAYEVSAQAAEAVRRARAAGGRIVAVGTTVVRTLEASAGASPDGLPRPGAGRTDLLILPGYAFRAVDALLTNFHLPRSTLLALVSAFASREAILGAYAEAVREGYRFYSYGDAMLVV